MDDFDRRLLGLLRADGRASVASLAAILRVSRGTVQNRIDRMVARGDIAGFTVKAATETDRVRAIMAIQVDGEKSGAVLAALRGVAEVEAVHTTNGRWDLIAELAADDLSGFSGALDAIRLIQGIGATETSLLLRSHRF